MKTLLLLGLAAFAAAGQQTAEPRMRARDLGLNPGVLPPGPLNAITDVPGVKVGQVTLNSGDRVRTGVTAIVPASGNIFRNKLPAAVYVGNGFGKLIGTTQIEELGVLETPIVLTNTLSVWRAGEALAKYTISQKGNEDVRSVNVVVGETNDGELNDIRGMHVEERHVLAAVKNAKGGKVEEGSVGSGTGTIAFGFKGGVGTSSRVVTIRQTSYATGVIVQTNFGGVLTIDGLPVGKELNKHLFAGDDGNGSVMVVLATDAPLDARQLKRLAKRAMLGVARTGSPATNGSGDYAVAFSTVSNPMPTDASQRFAMRTVFADDDMTPLFEATVEATEEAIYNSLLMATTTSGLNGKTVEAIPIEAIRRMMVEHGYRSRSR